MVVPFRPTWHRVALHQRDQDPRARSLSPRPRLRVDGARARPRPTPGSVHRASPRNSILRLRELAEFQPPALLATDVPVVRRGPFTASRRRRRIDLRTHARLVRRVLHWGRQINWRCLRHATRDFGQVRAQPGGNRRTPLHGRQLAASPEAGAAHLQFSCVPQADKHQHMVERRTIHSLDGSDHNKTAQPVRRAWDLMLSASDTPYRLLPSLPAPGFRSNLNYVDSMEPVPGCSTRTIRALHFRNEPPQLVLFAALESDGGPTDTNSEILTHQGQPACQPTGSAQRWATVGLSMHTPETTPPSNLRRGHLPFMQDRAA